MKIFVASNFENQAAARELENQLRADGFEITSTWVNQGPLADISLAPLYSKTDLMELDAADVLVVLWPGKQGTITEYGYALKAGKPIILHGRVPYERGVLGGNIHFHNRALARTATYSELFDELVRLVEKENLYVY